MQAKTEYISNSKNAHLPTDLDETEAILNLFRLKYKIVDYHFQVGEILKTQGWIIHLSVVISQALDLLNLIIPFLSEQKVPFKVAKQFAFEDILIGNLGIAKIGKIISIYPDMDATALNLAKQLIHLTKTFKGPAIPTDICLGNIVYTRYGNFNPILKFDAKGNPEKYIYDVKGSLTKDEYQIPFELPEGVSWPFQELKEPIPPDKPRYLNRLYKVTDILKADPRGNVYKGLFLKSLFQVKKCVLKQGIKHTASDYAGRDIQDRLIWQAELYKRLSNSIPMPAVYDLIREDDFTILPMEYIDGISLYHKIQDINPHSKYWKDLSFAQSFEIIKYAKEITSIVQALHKLEYVHRDIVPVNFLINSKGKLFLIDLELMYSMSENIPNPPFVLGTPGFMSPEQQAMEKPTKEQDIYSLGATLLYLFTGLTPVKFNTSSREIFSENLNGLIEQSEVSELITYALSPSPKLRPALPTIFDKLDKYQKQISAATKTSGRNGTEGIKLDKLNDTITWALNGLTKAPIVCDNNLWLSKKINAENFSAPVNKEYTKYIGLTKGIAGPIYLISRLHKAGFSIENCRERFFSGWEYVSQELLRTPDILPGLYKGAAGIAIALAETISSGLLGNQETNKDRIFNCLNMESERFDLAYGIAGQGVSLLHCKSLLEKEDYESLLNKIISQLLCLYKRNGCWTEYITSSKLKYSYAFDLGYDDTGIIWFLLKYLSVYPNKEVQKTVENALSRLLSNKQLMKSFDNQLGYRDGFEIGDGGKGMVLLFIRAYETLREERYKKIAEKALAIYPNRIIHSNFSQYNGLSALGELFLEAWRVFENEEWKTKANQIACTFLHTFCKSKKDSGYWVMEEYNPPTADFLSGVSGIIHFLARCAKPSQIGYRILNQ